MPIDHERQRTLIELMRQLLDDPAFDNADDGVRVQNLAEALTLVVARARDARIDEVTAAEVVLRAIGFHRKTLLGARQVLDSLGYTEIAALLKRLTRNAPRRLAWSERMAANARARLARQRLARPAKYH
jgi:predicted NAD/FAD-binding protein